MAAIDFPNSPTLNQTFTASNRTWKWNGSKWETVASTTIAPTAHASSHTSGGSDAVTIAQSQVTNLTTDLAGKAATSHTHTFANITDVNITSPTNGQSLTYDSASSKWINSAASAGGETISSFLLMGA
jgi:hypothetical protein